MRKIIIIILHYRYDWCFSVEVICFIVIRYSIQYCDKGKRTYLKGY